MAVCSMHLAAWFCQILSMPGRLNLETIKRQNIVSTELKIYFWIGETNDFILLTILTSDPACGGANNCNISFCKALMWRDIINM